MESRPRSQIALKAGIAYALIAMGALLALGKLKVPLSHFQAASPRMILVGVIPLEGLLWGAGTGLAGALAAELLSRKTRWGRALGRFLRNALGRQHLGDALLLALLSSAGEELLFRGLLLPYAGLTGSTALFGLAHLLPRRHLWLWSVWATIMGLAFGLLANHTGGLLAPVTAHFIINAIGLASLGRRSSG